MDKENKEKQRSNTKNILDAPHIDAQLKEWTTMQTMQECEATLWNNAMLCTLVH